MDNLTLTGMKVPDKQMTKRWLEEINQVKNLDFLSLTLKNPILDIFISGTPIFVVRTVIRDKNQQEHIRFGHAITDLSFFHKSTSIKNKSGINYNNSLTSFK
jgi:hypothetical protein